MRWWLFVPSAVLVFAVDRSKFRTCDQGSFCRRYKEWINVQGQEDTTTHWFIAAQSKQNFTRFDLQNKNEARPSLKVKMDFYAVGPARIRIHELHPIRSRYIIPLGDVTEKGLETIDPEIKPRENGADILWESRDKSATYRLEIQSNPFKILLWVNNVLTQTINGRNLFNFEIYRKTTEKRANVDAANHPNVKDDGLWTEHFHEHIDHKPKGPAALGVDVTFHQAPKVFGLPEHSTRLELNGQSTPYRLYNLDVFEYDLHETMALYGAVPIVWAPSATKPTTAFLWVNPSETFVKVDSNQAGAEHFTDTWWISESGVIDIFLFPGPDSHTVSAQYHAITGKPFMPPLFSLGKHQCRWNYKTEEEVEEVDTKFTQFDIPLDTIWLDIEHTNGKRYFTWDQNTFGNPELMQQKLAHHKRNLVTIVDPHIKKDSNYDVYNTLSREKLFVLKRDWQKIDDPNAVKPADYPDEIEDKSVEMCDTCPPRPMIPNPNPWQTPKIWNPNSPTHEYDGWCWPGTSAYPDFLNPKTRQAWAAEFKTYLTPKKRDGVISNTLSWLSGSTDDGMENLENLYTWNDMNEPSVFNGPEVTMPRTVLHLDGTVEHRDVHNLYGMYVHHATRDGQLAKNSTRRTFILTRSFFIGSHRTAAVWTGDNIARWDHLEISVPMIIAMALGGISNIGADVGGFFHHPESELMVRWHQFGALAYPFYRSHAHLESPRREPWFFSDREREQIRRAVRARYQLKPYWYTLFRAYEDQGTMVIRPIWYEFPQDPRAFDSEVMNTQMLVGRDLLVRVVGESINKKPAVSVHLPQAAYCWETHHYLPQGTYTVNLSPDYVPAYALAGSIFPLKKRLRRSTSAMSQDPYTLQIFVNESGEAQGSLYVDDFITFGYQKGEYLEVSFTYTNAVLSGTAKMPKPIPELGYSFAVERIIVTGVEEAKLPVVVKNGDKVLSFTKTPLSLPRSVQNAPTVNAPRYELHIKLPQIDLRNNFSITFETAVTSQQ